jgi:hypothetical protein
VRVVSRVLLTLFLAWLAAVAVIEYLFGGDRQ